MNAFRHFTILRCRNWLRSVIVSSKACPIGGQSRLLHLPPRKQPAPSGDRIGESLPCSPTGRVAEIRWGIPRGAVPAPVVAGGWFANTFRQRFLGTGTIGIKFRGRTSHP